ncbi:MAG: DUF192 domain-containing protein [Nanohaloarchaea archaeon]|nr:DUF192 domain-containing protein [Candidatus Nanohaloarchaea archaeon]
MRKTEVKSDREKFDVEVAESFISKSWGLSLRSSGRMLFVFNRNTGAKVDMMLLSKPLHLYFLDSEKKVIEKQKAEPWKFDPRTWKLYSPENKYRYLLESFERLEIGEGDKLEFEV